MLALFDGLASTEAGAETVLRISSRVAGPTTILSRMGEPSGRYTCPFCRSYCGSGSSNGASRLKYGTITTNNKRMMTVVKTMLRLRAAREVFVCSFMIDMI